MSIPPTLKNLMYTIEDAYIRSRFREARELQPITKIIVYPNILLMIQVKRFNYVRDTMTCRKVLDVVRFVETEYDE